MSYYDNSRPWPAVGQNSWNDLDLDGQTVRSGSSSTVPSQAPPPPSQSPDGAVAFSHQLEEVDRAIDNLVKSGKMFGIPGRHGRQGHGIGARPHSMAEFGDARGAHQSNLQNFYASQRHQSSRGSNEAEQMIQAKRRMAAQRERELRNYHQEQQFNRTVLADISPYGEKPDRALSPGSMSEADRRDLIARQRSALYGEGPFAETGGYVDETGTPRPGVPGSHHAPPAGLRGHSPLTYEYGRAPPAVGPGAPEGSGPKDIGTGSPALGAKPPSRSNSNASPQPNQANNDPSISRTSNSSPGNSPNNGKPGASNPGTAVAPIGTRPSTNAAVQPLTAGGSTLAHPASSKRSNTPLTSSFTSASGHDGLSSVGGASSNPVTTPDGSIGVSGWGSRGGSVWGSGKPTGMGVQASVWG